MTDAILRTVLEELDAGLSADFGDADLNILKRNRLTSKRSLQSASRESFVDAGLSRSLIDNLCAARKSKAIKTILDEWHLIESEANALRDWLKAEGWNLDEAPDDGFWLLKEEHLDKAGICARGRMNILSKLEKGSLKTPAPELLLASIEQKLDAVVDHLNRKEII